MEEWAQRLKAASASKLCKDNMNRLVLNFLVIEGYKAEVDLSSISDRMLIRSAVHGGEIQGAIERVNDLNPEILET
ncbi:hypothetical protein T484DRAFT_1834966 [Baffinella frigidus]|nr:hypothetical protein T484DRAFT_1834966 [Cryptophyta sp. CCMP2293]